MDQSDHPQEGRRQRRTPSSGATPFVGRQQELEMLTRWIAEEHIRLITIVAIGGMGKTRLAQEVARRNADEFDDGAFVVSLVDVSDASGIASAIANAIGIRFSSQGDPLQQLLEHLARMHALVVLDNFEHLLGHIKIVSRLLEAAPLCKVIVTSRQRLRLRSETVLDLGGLATDTWHTLDAARDASAVQLFLHAARQSRPELELTADNIDDIAAICAVVEGMPLGIELAAAWSSALTTAEIAAGARASLDFLETELQDMPERHRNMRAVLEQSVQLLSDHEREIFVNLSVFSDGFNADAATAIASADRHALAALVNKSMLHRDLQGRYAMHELLRQFGQEVLSTDPDRRRALCNHHARFYSQVLSGLEHALLFGDTKSACHVIEGDLANVYQAWDWMIEQGMFDDLYSASYALMCFREFQCRFLEFSRMDDSAIPALRQAPASPSRDLALAEAVLWHGWLCLRFGRLEAGLHAAQESWDLLQCNGLTARHSINGDPRAAIAVISALMGDLEIARHTGQELFAFYLARGDLGGMGSACYALSTVELAAGDYGLVRDYGQRGYEVCRRTNDRYNQAHILNNWANAERALGNLADAQRLLRESYENMCAVGSTDGQATALTHLAQIALQQGDYEEANRNFAMCGATFKAIGDDGGLAMTLEGQARIAIAQEHDQTAARLLLEALLITETKLETTSLSLLVCSCLLLLRAGMRELAAQILDAVRTHPAAREDNRREADQLLVAHHLPLPTNQALKFEYALSHARRFLATHEWQAGDESTAPYGTLTAREREILQYLAQGHSNSEIAGEVFMTVGTVKWYLNQIYGKLGVRNRTEAVTAAQRSRLLS